MYKQKADVRNIWLSVIGMIEIGIAWVEYIGFENILFIPVIRVAIYYGIPTHFKTTIHWKTQEEMFLMKNYFVYMWI